MANTTVQIPADLRGLVLSAQELKSMVDWPDALIEDYLALIDGLVTIVGVLNQKNDIIKTVSNVTSADSPYNINSADEEIFFDTTDGDIVANLPAGQEGRNYRLLNVGEARNKVILTPGAGELLFGESVPEYIYDFESLIITFDSDVGWF